MENILLGVRRNKGVLEDEKTGKKTPFDSVSLFIGDFRELGGKGFGISPKAYVVKIKTEAFYEVTGIRLKAFIEAFEEKFMFHKIRVYFEKNKFGKEIISSVRITKKDCYKLWQEEQDALSDLDDEDEDDDNSVDAIFDDNPDVAGGIEGLEDFDMDVNTGEVIEKAATKNKKDGGA